MLDCAIIGAGLAGLSAARHLVSRNLAVSVLEARDRVGGRVDNAVLGDGEYLEMGGQWIGSGHDRLMELAETFGLNVTPLPTRGNLVMRLRGRELSVPPSDETELNPFEVSDLSQGVLRLRRLGERLQKDQAWAAANQAWLGQPLHRWVQTNLRNPGAQNRFHEVYQAAFDQDPRVATLLQALERVVSGSELERLLATHGGLNQLRIDGGMHALCRAMADELGDDVRLGNPVVTVERSENSATVVLADGERVEARRVLCTLPPQVAVDLDFSPPLPAWRAETAGEVSQGNVIKSYLVYDRPFWREQGLSGHSSADEGAVQVTFDTSTADDGRGLLMGFFEGGADAGARTPAERQQAFVESAVRAFGEQAAHPVDYVERDWSAEPWTKGCHGAHFAPGLWTRHGPVLAQPEGVIHWAGAEYSGRYNGFMEGAVRSGEEVATAIAKEWA